MLRLVPLTSGACMHKILHELLHVRKMKVAAQSVQRALDSFMSILMDSGHDLLNEGGRQWNVQAPGELHHVVDDHPRCPAGARAHFVLDSDEGRVGELCLAETCDKVEARGREGQYGPFVRRVASRESVGHRVRRPRLVLDGEVKAQKLPHPVVLRDRREPLIEQVLEAIVVRLDEEAVAL